jgi:hypothetical protein
VDHSAAAATLAGRARTDDGRELVAEADRLAPEVAAALRWATAADPGLAAGLARSLAVLAEQCGPRLDGLDALARAARSTAVREAATGDTLYVIGEALCYGDLAAVDDLAAWALGHATDDRARLAAHHLAGYADAYSRRTAAAEAHLAEAERLATAEGETWALASVWQARGIALRYDGRPEAAFDAFAAAMRTFALAGDAMHVNNARYMMAATSTDSGLRTAEAIGWCDECVAYATRTGNAHELAHALLTRAILTATTDALPDAVATFRAAGDLRCLTRSHLLRARLTPEPAARVAALEEALAVATSAHDRANQAEALGALVDAHWSAGTPHPAAVALGRLTALVGEEVAHAAVPNAMRAALPSLAAAVAEGRARATG